MRFFGSEINLVMGMEEGTDLVSVKVLLDGEEVANFPLDFHGLFPLWKGEYGTHGIEIQIGGNGAEAYVFTFGVG